VNRPDIFAEVEQSGFSVIEDVLSASQSARLLAALDRIEEANSVRIRGSVFAIRNLLDVSVEVCELAGSDSIRALVEPVLGPDFFPVRGVLFDKIPDANWKVPWHQDVTIAVQDRVEVDGFGSWTVKADVLHVQPPEHILQHMLSARLHLDPCGEENGALRVIPGSHLYGRIPEQEMEPLRARTQEHICTVGVGGALLMRPLLMHASSPSRTPAHRRVIHIDFASVLLPAWLRWYSEPTHSA
jgi:hypothetical protein